MQKNSTMHTRISESLKLKKKSKYLFYLLRRCVSFDASQLLLNMFFLRAPKDDNQGLKQECDVLKKQLGNKKTTVLALQSQVERLTLEKRLLQKDACQHILVMTIYYVYSDHNRPMLLLQVIITDNIQNKRFRINLRNPAAKKGGRVRCA